MHPNRRLRLLPRNHFLLHPRNPQPLLSLKRLLILLQRYQMKDRPNRKLNRWRMHQRGRRMRRRMRRARSQYLSLLKHLPPRENPARLRVRQLRRSRIHRTTHQIPRWMNHKPYRLYRQLPHRLGIPQHPGQTPTPTISRTSHTTRATRHTRQRRTYRTHTCRARRFLSTCPRQGPAHLPPSGRTTKH